MKGRKPHRLGRKLHRFVPLALAVVTVSPPLLAGCAALAARSALATSQVLHRSPPVQLAIAQVRHGANAPFELCPIDACPKPTPKTLGSRSEVPVTPTPLAAASSPAPPSVGPLPPALTAPLSPVPFQPVHATPQTSPTEIKTIVVTFASGSALLTAAAQRQLAVILPDARRSPVIEIRGRTDELGSAGLELAAVAAWEIMTLCVELLEQAAKLEVEKLAQSQHSARIIKLLASRAHDLAEVAALCLTEDEVNQPFADLERTVSHG